MVEFDKSAWKLFCVVVMGVCCLQSAYLGFTLKDIDWHRQEVYDSWSMQEGVRI